MARGSSPSTDARVVRIGRSARLGRFVELRDVFGNTYTYGGLSRLARRFPVLRPAPRVAPQPRGDRRSTTRRRRWRRPRAHSRRCRAAGGPHRRPPHRRPPQRRPPHAGRGATGRRTQIAVPQAPAASAALAAIAALPSPDTEVPGPIAERTLDDRLAAELRAQPVAQGRRAAWRSSTGRRRRAAWASASRSPRPRSSAPRSDRPSAYDRRLLGGVAASRVRYRPLRVGSRVVAGTILGQRASARAPAARACASRSGRPVAARLASTRRRSSRAGSSCRPSSRGAAGLGTTGQPSIGQVMLLAKHALQRLVLANPRIAIYPCGREDIARRARRPPRARDAADARDVRA